jgi:anaerobic selenocysteine-containing dehydrogenase
MAEWLKTACVLCAQNCGLEVQVEDNRMVKVRAGKENLRSEGYICRKGRHVDYYQHHSQRLFHPLKRLGNDFQRVSWDQAIDEIAEKLQAILDAHGPRSYAYMGGGGQGAHLEGLFGRTLLAGLGSKYHYTALAQELTGLFWAWKQATGHQFLISDHHNTEVLLALGWNGMMSHQIPQARTFLKRFAKDPDKVLVVVDPRPSKTAKIADIHLPIRPGADALLTKAMIAIVLQEGWEDRDYIARHVSGLDEIRPWFENFDARAAIEVCQLDYDQVREVCRLTATRRSSMHPDLGVLMNRHSTATSCLEIMLMAICGSIGTPGGNIIPGNVLSPGGGTARAKKKGEEPWKTLATGFPPINGVYPPNVMPEEILSDHPERLRAVLCSNANPLRSYADTTEYEKAFKKLDLLVTCEVAMSETAQLSHYVLPVRTPFEAWSTTMFQWNYPEIFFQMRRPLIDPEGEQLEGGEIYTRLAERLGLIPEIPQELYDAAGKDRLEFAAAMLGYFQTEPKAMKTVPFILAKTLGRELGSVHLAVLWGSLMTASKRFQENAARVGFTPGPAMGEEIFTALLERPEGIWIGRVDPAKNLEGIHTEDGRINIAYPEMADWIRSITPASEAKALEGDADWPLILMAGRHIDTNANTIMRNPAWNKKLRVSTLAMHPQDAEALGLVDGQTVEISTEAASVEIELEVTESTRPGMVIIPHGFGLEYEGKTHGVNVNRLTKNTHRDAFAGTPLHRYVPCKVAGPASARET